MVNFKQIKAIVFDAYGTLFDISSLDSRLKHYFFDHSSDIAKLWRQKQLEYTWLRTMMGKYKNFSSITKDALLYACKAKNVELKEDTIEDLMLRYQALAVFPEVPHVVDTLRKKHHLAILSNAENKMLQSAVNHNNMEGVFNRIISVDVISKFKPIPNVYQLAVSGLEVDKEYIAFVSTNTWDVAGAKSFGFKTIWLNRNNTTPEELGVMPDLIINDLNALIGSNALSTN